MEYILENVLKLNLFSSSCSLGCFHTETLGWFSAQLVGRMENRPGENPLNVGAHPWNSPRPGRASSPRPPPPLVDTSLVLMAGVSAAPQQPRRPCAHLERVIHQPEGWSFPWIRSQPRTNPDFYCLFNGRSVWLQVLTWTSAGEQTRARWFTGVGKPLLVLELIC